MSSYTVASPVPTLRLLSTEVNLRESRRPSIHPAQEQGGGNWHVPFSVDGVVFGTLIVITTNDGNKIDWQASMRLQQLRVETSRHDDLYGFIEDKELSNTVKQWTAKKQAFPPGDYTPGSIPSGLYVYIPHSGSHYYSETDLNGNILDNEGFQSVGYVHVHGIGNVETRGFLVQHAVVQRSEYKTGKRVS
jgi:hypothetical protein